MTVRTTIGAMTATALAFTVGSSAQAKQLSAPGQGVEICKQAEAKYEEAIDAALEGLLITATEMLDQATEELLDLADYLDESSQADPTLEYARGCYNDLWKKVKELDGLLRVVTVEPGTSEGDQASLRPEHEALAVRVDHHD